MTYDIATCMTMLMAIVIAADIILIWLEAVSIAMAITISNLLY